MNTSERSKSVSSVFDICATGLENLGVRNQLFTYSSEFARYVTEYTKSNKKYHANDFTNWILHFRCDANDDELKFNGVILDSYDKSIGVYVINLRPDYTIKDIDFQIENFVMNYVLKNL